MRAIGLARVTDTDQLIGGHICIKLDVKQDAQYGASNEVKGFRSVNGSAAPTSNEVKGFRSVNGSAAPTAASVPASGAPAAASKAAPPWAKK